MADNITIEKCEIGDFVIINVTIRLRAVILSILSIAIGSKLVCNLDANNIDKIDMPAIKYLTLYNTCYYYILVVYPSYVLLIYR